MTIRSALVFTLLTVISPFSQANNGSLNVSSACATLEFMAKMTTLNTMLPGDFDRIAELRRMEGQLAELNRLVCQRVIQTGFSRGNSVYSNGSLVSTDLYYDSWYFPNGQLFMRSPGEDLPVYYPNGRVMAYHWTHGGDAVFWPNGSVATNAFQISDVTWYYPDGNIITFEAGYSSGRWFYPFPRLDGRAGQEVISSNWGEEDEDFTFLNFDSQGRAFTTRERIRRKLVFSDADLLDVPGVLLLITRLYQFDDNAKQFTPADVNITGAPY